MTPQDAANILWACGGEILDGEDEVVLLMTFCGHLELGICDRLSERTPQAETNILWALTGGFDGSLQMLG